MLLLVGEELAIGLLLANRATIEIHFSLVARSCRVAESVPFLEGWLIQRRHHEQIRRHLGSWNLLLRLVLLLPLQCNRGSSCASDSLHVLPILEKSWRLAVLLSQAWGKAGLGLSWIIHLHQLHLLQLKLVRSLLGSLLRLANLLSLLEQAGFIRGQRCLVVEVTASRLLVREVQRVVDELLVAVGEWCIPAHGDAVRLRQACLPLQQILLRVLLCVQVLVVLVLLEDDVHAPSYLTVSVRLLAGQHVGCLRGSDDRAASNASAHSLALRDWRLLTGLRERVLLRREDVVREKERRRAISVALLGCLVVAHRRVVV